MLFSDVQSVERLRSPVDFGKTKRMSILIKSEISQIVPWRKNLKVEFKLVSTLILMKVGRYKNRI